MKQNYLSAVIYLGIAIVCLIISACLSIPKLYYPLFFCGCALGLMTIKLGAIVIAKISPKMYHSGVAMVMAILALVLLYLLPDYHWTAESPEPVRLGLIWLSQLQGCCVVTTIFAALDAKSDKASAIIAFLLAVVTLFLMGYQGMENLMQKSAAASVVVTIVFLVGEQVVGRIRN